MDTFIKFANENDKQHSEIDYFYILENLDEREYDLNSVKKLFKDRFENFYNKEIKNK